MTANGSPTEGQILVLSDSYRVWSLVIWQTCKCWLPELEQVPDHLCRPSGWNKKAQLSLTIRTVQVTRFLVRSGFWKYALLSYHYQHRQSVSHLRSFPSHYQRICYLPFVKKPTLDIWRHLTIRLPIGHFLLIDGPWNQESIANSFPDIHWRIWRNGWHGLNDL